MSEYLTDDSSVFNIVKALGIISMVKGHASAPVPLKNFIYLYHMALFFFMSGYFFKEEYNFKTFLIKRIKSLYVPFVGYFLLFRLMHNVLYKLNFINSTVLVDGKLVQPYSSIGEFAKKTFRAIYFWWK